MLLSWYHKICRWLCEWFWQLENPGRIWKSMIEESQDFDEQIVSKYIDFKDAIAEG